MSGRLMSADLISRVWLPKCLQMQSEFEEQWQAGSVPGWEDRGEGGQQADGAAASGALDLDAFDSADELEMLGV